MENQISFEAATIETAITNNNKINVTVNNSQIQALVDTGATVSVISRSLLQKLATQPNISCSKLASVKGVCSTIHQVSGETTLTISIKGHEFTYRFFILDQVQFPLILGADFLTENKATVDMNKGQVLFHNTVTVAPFCLDERECIVGFAKTQFVNDIPAHSEFNIRLQVSKTKNNTLVLLEPTSILTSLKLVGGRCLTRVRDGIVILRILNPTNHKVHINARKVLAKAYQVDETCIFSLDHTQDQQIGNTQSDTQLNTTDSATSLDLKLDNENLTHDQQKVLHTLLNEHRDIFAKDASELGKTNMHFHRIDTTTDKPVKSRPYSQTPAARKETDVQIEHMLKHDIIEESTSQYHSPVVLVKKKNGSYRFAVDYRKLNSVTEGMSFPIPRIKEALDTIADSKAAIFSVLDLASGFWQVPLDPDTKHKTAFITHRGLYHFKRMPFGLMNAPMTYQMLMTKVLKELNWKIALIYIDDILVFSKSFEDHVQHLRLVFQKLREANLTLQPTKCYFASSRVKYLGHVISKHGIQVDPDNTAAVETFPTPRNVKQVRSFLGMCNYYRKFIKDYSKIAAPLSALLRKSTKFHWNSECGKSFNTLKTALLNAPILAFPDFSKQFVLSTDASDTAIGYILGQINPDNGLEHVVSYGGRSLTACERKWHINEKEGLALVEAIKTFKSYLSTNKFIVYTDNLTVRWLNNNKDPTGKLGRWSLYLQSFNFEIVHRAGSKNNADALSRRDYTDDRNADSRAQTESPTVSVLDDTASSYISVTFEYNSDRQTTPLVNVIESVVAAGDREVDISDNPILQRLQEEDADFREIIHFKKTGDLPDNEKTANAIYIQAQHYHISNGLLYHLHQDRGKGLPPDRSLIHQLAVPKSHRLDILEAYHDCIAGGGHQGFDRTLASIRSKYYWPRMYTDIEEYIRTCETCQKSKRPIHNKRVPLTPIPTEELFSRWHMDILELPCTADNYRYVLLVVDSFSRYPEAFPLKSQEATEVARVLFHEVFSRWGAPRTLISDRGQNFMSKLVQALSELFDVRRHYTSSYHPQTNAVCERMNSFIIQTLRTYCSQDPTNWTKYLTPVLMAYRRTPATESTKVSPFFALFGQEMRLPIDTTLIPKPTMVRGHHLFSVRYHRKHAHISKHYKGQQRAC